MPEEWNDNQYPDLLPAAIDNINQRLLRVEAILNNLEDVLKRLLSEAGGKD